MEIRAPANKFHDVFGCRPHHLSNVSPTKIQGSELHEGNWGISGTVVSWSYFHDGEAKTAKEIIENIDNEKLSTTFRVIDGDLMKLYKNIHFIVQATPKGEGSVVHWTIEYEKQAEQTPEPFSMLEFCAHVSKDVDAHLVAQAK